MTTIAIEEAVDPAGRALCLQIRREVFVEEQGVSVAEEVDGLDDQCRHYLLRIDGRAIGAARVKPSGDALKIQRVAIRKSARGSGLGAALMRKIIASAAVDQPGADLVLGAQTEAIGFYEKLGFVVEGDEYMDAGIPHRDMRLTPAAISPEAGGDLSP